MKLRYAVALLPLALAACDEKMLADVNLPWDKPLQTVPDEPTPTEALKPVHTPPAVSPLEQAIELADGEKRVLPTAEAETYKTDAFVAQGNAPFWRAQAQGKSVLYITTEGGQGRKVAVERLVFAKGVEYAGVLDGAPFALTIRGTDCTDATTGKTYPMTASLYVGRRTLSGCASAASTATAEATTETNDTPPVPRPDAG